MTVGRATKQAQLNDDVSNIVLAKGIGKSEEWVSNCRNDKMKTIRFGDLTTLADFFHLTVSEFIKLGEPNE